MVKLPGKLNLKRFKSRAPKNTFFTIDIGSNSVKVLVFKREVDKPNEVTLLGIAKEYLESQHVRAGNIVEVEKVAESIDTAIFKATEGIEESINDVIFGIGGDLCICNVTTAKINRGSKAEISEKEADNIHAKVSEAAYIQAQKRLLRNTGNTSNNLELITSSIVYSKIDGEHATHLTGKTGQKIEVAYFTAFAPRYHLETLQEIAALLKLNILAITSNMYALGQALKISSKNDKLDVVLIDIGADTTEVGVIFGGGIVETKTLNIGGNQFTSKLATDTGLARFDAEKKKLDSTFGNLPDSELIKIESVLTEVTGIWLSGMELLFSEFTGVKTFPTDICLVGGSSKLPVILEGLQTKPWTKSIPFREPPEFSKITANDFKFVHDVTGESDQAEYIVPAALSAIYLELFDTSKKEKETEKKEPEISTLEDNND